MTAAAAVLAVLQHLPVETVAAAAIFKTQIENFTIKSVFIFYILIMYVYYKHFSNAG